VLRTASIHQKNEIGWDYRIKLAYRAIVHQSSVFPKTNTFIDEKDNLDRDLIHVTRHKNGAIVFITDKFDLRKWKGMELKLIMY
jgi:hypothetical protein